jgi:hypothetical protein
MGKLFSLFQFVKLTKVTIRMATLQELAKAYGRFAACCQSRNAFGKRTTPSLIDTPSAACYYP